MHALPFALAVVLAALLAGPVLRLLADGGALRQNFRGRVLPCPFGVLLLIAALPAYGVLMLVTYLGDVRTILLPASTDTVLLALGACMVGLIDDFVGRGDSSDSPRGLRGHARTLRSGRLTTGAVKAVALPAVALVAVLRFVHTKPAWLVAAALVLAATHAFNLLDVRPGRVAKSFVLLGAGLTIGALDVRPLWSVGLLAGPALVAGLYDVRERAMLGDAGASTVGAVAGLWLVLTLSTGGQIAALAVLLAIALYGELRSLSALIERTPGVRQLDSWGTPS